MTGGRERALALFGDRFGGRPELVVRSPGRVNLIGDHTDYNGGFVLPMALEHATWIAARRASPDQLALVSESEGELAVDLGAVEPGEGWAEYVKGVAVMLLRDGRATPGWEGAVATDVPVGAGLSSSAALEVGVARVFAAVAGEAWDGRAAALLCQRAENEWVGVPTGIMDQLVVATASAGAAKLIDCRSLESSDHGLPGDATVVVLDTGTRRALGGSHYADRRAACERAAAALGVAQLRDATPEMLAARTGALDPGDMARAQHVVAENARVLAAVEALEAGDAGGFGRLMDASHASMRDLFEVSSPAFEAMVAAARRAPGCRGARISGGGFAGCAVALVDAGGVEDFRRETAAAYRSRTGRDAAIYPSRPAAAVGVEG